MGCALPNDTFTRIIINGRLIAGCYSKLGHHKLEQIDGRSSKYLFVSYVFIFRAELEVGVA